MKRIMILLLGLALMAAFSGCAGNQTPIESPGNPESAPQTEAVSLPAPVESADPVVVDGVNGMGIDMLKRLYPDMNGDNFMISPASISLALSMTMNGAQGDTFIQMGDALHVAGMEMDTINQGQKDLMSILLNPDGTDKVKVEIANSLWACEDMVLTESFQDTCKTYYDAGRSSWISPTRRPGISSMHGSTSRPHGMIPTIIDGPIEPEEVMFLINTLYFDGKWSLPFDPERTFDGTFTKADGTEMTVPMMSAEEDVMVYVDSDADCFGKSFGNTGRLEMLFIRPKGDLHTFVRGFSPERLAQIIEGSHESELLIHIPRFSYDTSLKLKEF